MQSRHAKLAGVAVCAGVLITPAPASAQAPVSTHVEALDPLVEMTQRAHARAVRRNVRLHRRNADLRGAERDRDRADKLTDWSTEHVRDHNSHLRERNKVLRRKARERARAQRARAERARAARAARAGRSTAGAAATGGSGATPGHLQAIAACESGGNPRAVGGGGAYRGKYQFDYGTWASVGGTGDPAAAPEAEQDRRAAMLYARRGSAPWPTCG